VTWTPYTYTFNLSGQPAISLPCGLSAGLPVGLQIVAAWGCEQTVLGFAQTCADVLTRAGLSLPPPPLLTAMLGAEEN
jgi:aspartyl-tRNA(Asn)/glutamyl-tRNA(Gln) amidotransferase subunit A